MISPRNLTARESARWLLPEAVGPRMATAGESGALMPFTRISHKVSQRGGAHVSEYKTRARWAQQVYSTVARRVQLTATQQTWPYPLPESKSGEKGGLAQFEEVPYAGEAKTQYRQDDNSEYLRVFPIHLSSRLSSGKGTSAGWRKAQAGSDRCCRQTYRAAYPENSSFVTR